MNIINNHNHKYKCIQIEQLQKVWPVEFQRKIRSLSLLGDFKASELRVWLLYHGHSILQHHLNEDQYKHFCLIHFGIRLLFLSGQPSDQNIELSQKCINQFLAEWPQIYPNLALTCVVHQTEHLPEDCRANNSTPDKFSAFAFESFLRRVKRNHHTGGKGLEQVCLFL